MCNKYKKDIYVASCVKSGGIYHYTLEDGVCSFVSITKMDRPMYMVIDNRKMYIVLRAPFENNESGVLVYDLDENGDLINPSEIISTKGEVACHIDVHDGRVYCANYTSGSVILLPDKLVEHKGVGIHPTRQEGPHVHYVGVTPDERYICVTDLGLDTIYLYRTDMTLQGSVKVPEGHGVRHLAFSDDGKYLFAVNELKSTVAAFSYNDGKLDFVDIHSCLPETFTGDSTASAIRVRDGLIYVSNRGHDSIAVLQFQNERLELKNHVYCGGKTPRDFVFLGKYLLCTNQDSNTVSLLDADNGCAHLCDLDVEMPICVCCH